MKLWHALADGECGVQEAGMPEHHRIAVFRIVHGEHTPDGDTLNWEARPDTSLLPAGKMQGISAHAFCQRSHLGLH